MPSQCEVNKHHLNFCFMNMLQNPFLKAIFVANTHKKWETFSFFLSAQIMIFPQIKMFPLCNLDIGAKVQVGGGCWFWWTWSGDNKGHLSSGFSSNSFRPQDFITSCLPILSPTQPGKHFLDAVVGGAALLKCLSQSDLILATWTISVP